MPCWAVSEAAGAKQGPAEAWIAANKKTLQLAGTIIGFLVLVLWDWPGGNLLIIVGLCLAAYLGLVEFVARMGDKAEES